MTANAPSPPLAGPPSSASVPPDEAERALLLKPWWSFDELIGIAFLARRLAGLAEVRR